MDQTRSEIIFKEEPIIGIFEKLKGFIKDQRDMRKLGYGEIIYPGVGTITDEEVANFVKEHTHWWDRLDPEFMTRATLLSQNMLMGVCKEPSKKDWKFPEDVWDNQQNVF